MRIMCTSLPLRFLSLAALSLVASACAGGDRTASGEDDSDKSHLADADQAQPDDGNQALLRPCDPLAAHELPIELGSVIAAGRDGNGAIYVAATPPGELYAHVFVSAGDTLYRKRVVGSGTSGDGVDADFTWSFDDGLTTRRLVAERRAGAITGIALAASRERSFFAELGPDAELLAIIDASALSDLKVRNLSGEVVVEFVARAADGSVLVVTRPRDDASYEDFRVFYGRDGQLSERSVANFGRTKSGSTYFTFSNDGDEFEAYFPSSDGAQEAPTLSGAGDMLTLTSGEATAEALAGMSFVCLPT